MRECPAGPLRWPPSALAGPLSGQRARALGWGGAVAGRVGASGPVPPVLRQIWGAGGPVRPPSDLHPEATESELPIRAAVPQVEQERPQAVPVGEVNRHLAGGEVIIGLVGRGHRRRTSRLTHRLVHSPLNIPHCTRLALEMTSCQ
jgi:hypothetical protein